VSSPSQSDVDVPTTVTAAAATTVTARTGGGAVASREGSRPSSLVAVSSPSQSDVDVPTTVTAAAATTVTARTGGGAVASREGSRPSRQLFTPSRPPPAAELSLLSQSVHPDSDNMSPTAAATSITTPTTTDAAAGVLSRQAAQLHDVDNWTADDVELNTLSCDEAASVYDQDSTGADVTIL